MAGPRIITQPSPHALFYPQLCLEWKTEKLAQGGLSVENGCFEEMRWADSEVFCEMVSGVFRFSLGLGAREPTSSPFAVIYKLIIILIDFAHSEWRLAGDKRSDGARLELDGYKSTTQQLHLSATSRYREWKD